MRFVWISAQTATFALYHINWQIFYNRGGECLLRGTNWVLTLNVRFVFKKLRSWNPCRVVCRKNSDCACKHGCTDFPTLREPPPNSACACKHGCTDFPTVREPPPNSRRQQADMKQVLYLGSTILEWTVNLSDLWTLVLSGLCARFMWTDTRFCVRKRLQ